jgi:hypothetical protein
MCGECGEQRRLGAAVPAGLPARSAVAAAVRAYAPGCG